MAGTVPTYNDSAARTHLKHTPNASNALLSHDPPRPPPPPDYLKGGETGANASPALAPAARMSKPPTPLPFAPLFRAHQIIGIYKASYSDLTLALSATDANPLCYISTHAYSRPHMQLLNGAAAGDPTHSAVLASAEFRHFSSSTTIAAGPVTEQLDREGVFGAAWVMHMLVPASGVRERFEWRASSAPEVRRLEGRSKGMKFVRVGTGEVMAVYAGVSGWSTKKVGKFRWVGGLGGRTDVGDAGELLCVMSLLAVLEKARRSRNRSSAAVSAGAAGGFSGGGGC